jgi:isoleucyl-tRNA synthetase
VQMELAGKYDPKGIEGEIRRYLQSIDLNSALENELRDNEQLVAFIEGPPTMNGEPHVGHLRGRIIKDFWYRFSTLQKKKVLFRAGWDTQGLPVELQAEKELGLTGNKMENIRKVGLEKIVETCKKVIHRYNKSWIATDKLLGMSFNYEKAYWTFHDEYIEREWKYLKRAWETGMLTEWFRVVAYCPGCQTSLSNGEVNQGYQNVEDPSLYYKVKLIDHNEYLVVWTTMPFTLVTDELIGVNPDANYVYVKINSEVWIIGENRIEALMSELRITDYHVEKTVLGKELDGIHYVHPLLEFIPKLKELAAARSIHFIVAEEFVDVTTGSGIVHLSPANGENDFETAAKRNLPIFVPIDDRVNFTSEAGSFANTFVRDADMRVVEALRTSNALLKIGKIKHQYPTCWRSQHKLVWLARREYFYVIDRLGDMPTEAANRVDYFFEAPKNRFLEIIKEKVPWCITRERIWGTPLPIWSCIKCQHKDALFSREEILKKSICLPDGPGFELHRPQIDRIEIKCEKCGSNMRRELFVLDTWHNSGAAPYASLSDYEFKNLIPAVFMTEGIDQTRGWAYTLLIENVTMNQKAVAPFRSFLFQGHVLDETGNKMSKSIGNIIDGHALLNEHPVDLIRFYFMWKSSPIDSLKFSLQEMRSRPYQILSTLYYLHVYFKQNSTFDGFDSRRHDLEWVVVNELMSISDIWLISKLQHLIEQVSWAFERCRFNEGAKAIEDFLINHMSQMYIPFTRNIIWDDNPEGLNLRLAIYAVIAHCLERIDIMLNPLTPFMTEYLYLSCFSDKKSVMLESWPKYHDRLVNKIVEQAFDKCREIISLSNAARMKAMLKRRWPIKEAIICTSDANLLQTNGIAEILKTQLNVENYRIFEMKDKTFLHKLLDLIEDELPIVPDVFLIKKSVGSKVRADIVKVSQALTEVDKVELIKSLEASGKYTLSYDNKQIDLSSDDLEFSYVVREGYAMSERDNLMVFVSTKRDKDLITRGLLRDLARNLQQLRKERGYNPTDIVPTAFVAKLSEEEISSLYSMKEELLHLVRVKSVLLSETSVEKVSYKTIQLDERELEISVE